MSTPAFEYFPHDADIGVVGYGPTIEAAFASCAAGMFAVMVDPTAVRPLRSVRVEFDEADPEIALVRWLNGLLAEARSEQLALSRFELRRDGERWSGVAWGEPWHAGLERGTEVKGATFTMLAVTERADGWEARCVVDV